MPLVRRITRAAGATAAILLVIASGACASRERAEPTYARGDSSAAPGAGTVPDDSASLARLYARVHALAVADGCTRAGDCRAAAVGVKACGGPQEYVAYCAHATDSVRLASAIAELDRAERAYNATHHVMSTCVLVTPPTLAIANGRCVAAPGGAGSTAVP